MVARDAGASRDSLRRVDLSRVALAVPERERVDGKAFASRDREHGRRVEPSAEEDHGWRH